MNWKSPPPRRAGGFAVEPEVHEGWTNFIHFFTRMKIFDKTWTGLR